MNENKSLTPPCKNCENRKPLCHGGCEGYLKF